MFLFLASFFVFAFFYLPLQINAKNLKKVEYSGALPRPGILNYRKK